MAYSLTLQKHSARQLRPDAVRKQIDRIVSRAMAGRRGRQWIPSGHKRTPEPIAVNGSGYAYRVSMSFKPQGRKAEKSVLVERFAELVRITKQAANSPGWEVVDDDDAGSGTNAAAANAIPGRNGHSETPLIDSISPRRAYAKVRMDPDRSKFFENIYARDPQIALVLSAVDAAVKSNFQNRFHAVLYGPPACGKTAILNAVADMVGEESVLRFDCTSTTKAGAEKILLEAAEVPPVMICEEIEKTDEASLRWLLGLLDHRAEIRKTNYRVGTLQRKVHVLTLATVNDIALFESVMDGALASRFSHKVYCPRPDKTVLRRILEREIAATDEDGKPLGRHEWIEPAIDYVVDREKSNDPRRVITVCLSGGDKLLTGEYQKYLEAARDPRLDGKKI